MARTSVRGPAARPARPWRELWGRDLEADGQAISRSENRFHTPPIPREGSLILRKFGNDGAYR
jgi:hypothetical protein